MTMPRSSVAIIPVLWCNLWAAAPQGPAAKLGAGIDLYEKQQWAAAVPLLEAGRKEAPKLADYAAFYLASAHAERKDWAAVRRDVAPLLVWTFATPLAGKGWLLEAQALTQNGQGAAAVRVLRERYAGLPQPLADLGLAKAYEQAGDPVQAAIFYQRVYFAAPGGEAAAQAGQALAALRESLGAGYPPPMPPQILGRVDRWIAARQYTTARNELDESLSALGGDDRDLALVRIGAVDYLRGRLPEACRYLENLALKSDEAAAEALYYQVECARKLDPEKMRAKIDRLAREHPRSQWRLKALLSAGNKYLLENRPDRYEPIYQACADSFPDEPEAANCHWKAAWPDYLGRRKEAALLLRDHLVRFPGSPHAAAALYFLGRLAENARDYPAAKAWYAKIVDRFPSYYYGLMARERLSRPDLARAGTHPQVAAFTAQLALPARRPLDVGAPSPDTQRRIERARLLLAAGQPALAEAELRFGANHDGQPHLLAMELARTSEPHQGLRYMKNLVSDYLTVPLDEAPKHFWEYLFPLPYRRELAAAAGAQALDAAMVAGLIRQESEFNPRALSRAKAMGLTQVLPSTGRQLARRAGMKRFSTAMLYQPGVNLKLGTMMLRSMLDQWNGKWEEALASYNAGKSRVDDWIHRGDFQEPSEFVETIPFTETREYVQSVLRNGAMYRRLYGETLAAEAARPQAKRAASPRPAVRKKSARPPG